VVTALVVDDQRSFADAVALALDSQPGLRCVGAVGTVAEAMKVLDEGCPDVVLLDVMLPGMGGIEAIHLFRERCPSVRVLILTADQAPATFAAAVREGADGFLPKLTPFGDILEAVRRGDDKLLIDLPILDRVMREGEEMPPLPASGVDITPRELQVLRLLAGGTTVKQVAHRLDISVHTCRAHVRGLLAKLEVHSQLAAVVKAARLGLLRGLEE